MGSLYGSLVRIAVYEPLKIRPYLACHNICRGSGFCLGSSPVAHLCLFGRGRGRGLADREIDSSPAVSPSDLVIETGIAARRLWYEVRALGS